MEGLLTDFKFKIEQKRDQIRNHITNVKSKLSQAILDIKIGDLRKLYDQHSLKTYESVQDHMTITNGALANITNQTLNNMSSAKKSSRTDDGEYILSFPNYFNFFFFSHLRCWFLFTKQILVFLSFFSFANIFIFLFHICRLLFMLSHCRT